MKQTVNTRRESGICQFPPLFYFRVSQPLRNLFSPFFSSFKFSLNRVQIYIYITQFFKPLWNCILKKNQLETKSHYSLPVKKNRFRNTTYYHVSAQHQDLGSRHKPPPLSLLHETSRSDASWKSSKSKFLPTTRQKGLPIPRRSVSLNLTNIRARERVLRFEVGYVSPRIEVNTRRV